MVNHDDDSGDGISWKREGKKVRNSTTIAERRR